jgi:hypothetical protein
LKSSAKTERFLKRLGHALRDSLREKSAGGQAIPTGEGGFRGSGNMSSDILGAEWCGDDLCHRVAKAASSVNANAY